MSKKAKQYILEETAFLFPGEDMSNAIDLFFEVLDYPIQYRDLAGVGDRIKRAIDSLVNDKHDKDSLSNLFPALNKIEQYARKILVMLDPVTYQKIVANNDGFGAVQSALQLSLSSNKKRRMRDIRNVEDHSCINWTLSEFYTNINKYLAAYINLTDCKADELNALMHPEDLERSQNRETALASSYFPSTYLRQIVESYDNDVNSGFRYVDYHWADDEDPSKDYNVEDLLGQSARKRSFAVKLLGEAGSGKTTALRRIEYVIAKRYNSKKTDAVPVFVSLCDISDEARGCIDHICKKLQIDRNTLNNLMNEGSIILLLDGYNEILDGKTMKNFATYIDREVRFLYPKTRIFMSDRIISRGSMPILTDAVRLHLKTISLEEKLRYFKSMTTYDAYNMISERASNNPEYFENLNTPYKLLQFVEIVNTTNSIPIDLTTEYLTNLIERERNEKKEVEMRDIEDFLEAIAIYLDCLYDANDAYSDGLLEIELQKKFAEIKTLLGVNTDTKRLINLLIGMNILTRENDGLIRFYSQEYLNFFMLKGIEHGMDALFD